MWTVAELVWDFIDLTIDLFEPGRGSRHKEERRQRRLCPACGQDRHGRKRRCPSWGWTPESRRGRGPDPDRGEREGSSV